MDNKKKCFVIMPVSETKSCTQNEWTGIFEHMIKPAVTGSRLGYECERAKPLTGAFVRDILEGLNRSDVVIADLTDRNPNVCYELGIRHTLKRRTILIAQNIDDVPSDLRSYWVVTYGKSLTGAQNFKKKVREILREMHKNPKKPDSPVADFLEFKNIDIYSYEKSANVRKLCALISELSGNINSVDGILKTVQESQERRQKGERKFVISSVRLSNSCLELLLSTSYITLAEDLLHTAASIDEQIRLINSDLDLWREAGFAKSVEGKLTGALPHFKETLTSALKDFAKLENDYQNDNYQEPKEPTILAANDHLKMLEGIISSLE